jgi:hypothetical protein
MVNIVCSSFADSAYNIGILRISCPFPTIQIYTKQLKVSQQNSRQIWLWQHFYLVSFLYAASTLSLIMISFHDFVSCISVVIGIRLINWVISVFAKLFVLASLNIFVCHKQDKRIRHKLYNLGCRLRYLHDIRTLTYTEINYI